MNDEGIDVVSTLQSVADDLSARVEETQQNLENPEIPDMLKDFLKYQLTGYLGGIATLKEIEMRLNAQIRELKAKNGENVDGDDSPEFTQTVGDVPPKNKVH